MRPFGDRSSSRGAGFLTCQVKRQVGKPAPRRRGRAMSSPPIDPLTMIRPRRAILGQSAILLPFLDNGEIDWGGFVRHVARTAEAGLVPAVNMDTGFVNLLENTMRQQVLARTHEALAGGPFVAGAFVADRPGDRFDRDAYLRQMEPIG